MNKPEPFKYPGIFRGLLRLASFGPMPEAQTPNKAAVWFLKNRTAAKNLLVQPNA